MKWIVVFSLIGSHAYATSAEIRMSDDVWIHALEQQQRQAAQLQEQQANRKEAQRERYLELTAIRASLQIKASQLKGLRLTKIVNDPSAIERSYSTIRADHTYYFSDQDQKVICKAHAIIRDDSIMLDKSIDHDLIKPNVIDITCRESREGRVVHQDQLTENHFRGDKLGQFKSLNRANGVDQVFTPTFENGKIVKYSMTEKLTFNQKIRAFLGVR